MANQDPSFTLEDIPGKGKGLVAKQRLPRGNLVTEEPKRLTTESQQSGNNRAGLAPAGGIALKERSDHIPFFAQQLSREERVLKHCPIQWLPSWTQE